MENCPSLKCFYSILGVEKGSSASEIRTAYRKLAMRWHPDKCSNMKGDAEEQAKLKFQVVQEAYSVLSDKNKRLLYDAGLHGTDDDPCMQDFMAELVSLMKGACSASTQSSTDYEFAKLSKLFTDMADTDNYVPNRQESHLSRASPQWEQDKVKHQPFAPVPPPKPHPNLFTSMDCSGYNFPGNFDVESRSLGCQFDQPATSCPQPHPNLFKGPRFFDTIVDHDGPDWDFRNFTSTQDSVLPEPQQSYFTPEQHSFNPGPSSQRSTHFDVAVSQTSTIESSTTSAAPSFNSERFCMGASGDSPGRDYRLHGKSTKARRKPRCKEKTPVVAPPADQGVSGK